MPQGWRPTHPGDPTPRWGLGRTGRLVILGTVVVGIIIALVIMTTRTAGAADDIDEAAIVSGSASTPEASQRVEVREPGYAVTFPEGWVIEATGGESWVVSPDRSTRCLTNVEWAPEPIDDPAAVLDQVAAMYPVFSDDGPLPVIETSEIELPAGRAIRFITDFTLDPKFDESDSEDVRYGTTYILVDDLRFLFFACWAPDRPDDDWLSIAETFELLPKEA